MMRRDAGEASPIRRSRPYWARVSLMMVSLLVVGRVVAVGTPAPAQDGREAMIKVYFDSSHTADALLRSAENHVRAGDYAEAIEIYQRVAQLYGDKVVEVPPDGPGVETRLSINARHEAQRRIAAFPPEARALYQARVDAQAELWYRQGANQRDRVQLRRVVDQLFCSSWGDDALDLLGDLAFQEGQFAEALEAYGQLVPDRAMGGAGLVHPDPSVDMTRVAAKKFLCRAAIGEHPPTDAELTAFAQAHPTDSTSFAGRRGPLASDLAAAVRSDHLGPPAQADGRWPTFGGSFTRDRIAAGPIDVGSLQWRVGLEPITVSRNSYRRSIAGMPAPDRLLAYHPIIVGDQVLVANDHRITAYDLNVRASEPAATSGTQAEEAWRTSELAIPKLAGQVISGLPRYTLTAVGQRVYARMGPPAGPSLLPRRMGVPIATKTPSYIVAVDRSSDGKLIWPREATDIALPKRPGNGTSPSAVFEGAPVADAHSVYVGLTDRVEMAASYVVCLDADSGATRWVRYVCEANNDPLAPSFEITHRLLTLAGSTLYYQTNLGALAALDAETGGVRWLATYPWSGRGGLGGAGGGFNAFGMMGGNPTPPTQQRDLNPAIVHDGLVIIAPDETPRIFAFDAATGRLVWKTDEIPDDVKLSHLLGVAKGHLIATGDRVLWFDIKTGKQTYAWPEKTQTLQGFGRGLLAGDRVYWPTKTEIHILDQATGLRADPPIRLEQAYGVQGGNLAVGDGYLIVAQADSMVVFCQNSRLIERYRDEIARSPDDALNYFRLAQAAEAIGRDEVALESLDLALPRARTSETIDGTPLAEATREHRRRLLMKLGDKAKLAKNWAEAARRFDEASEAAPRDRDRLAARLELAEVQLASGDARGAVRTWQNLLGDESLRALTVDATDGHRTVRADLLIVDRLNNLLKTEGREFYADFDTLANDLLIRARKRQDPRLLEDLGRHYPAARVVPDALRTLGVLYDELGRSSDAARTYKRLLAGATDDADRAWALWKLAGSFEAQGLWVPAREAYLQAALRQPGLALEGAGGKTLASAVAARLDQPPFNRVVGDQSEPSVPVPLRRRWDRHWAGVSKLIVAAGTPPSAESARVFLTQSGTIRPVDPASGESRWHRELAGEPNWVGYLADRVIVATPTRIVALGLTDGAVEWQFDLGVGTNSKPGADPFAREPAEGGRDATATTLGAFRLVGNRVFCLQGQQTLLAFDGDTGLVDWSYTTPAGRINPRIHVGPARIALQIREPNSILVLDTTTGRRGASFPRADDEEWLRDPLPIDDDHLAVVADRLTVALLDLDQGAPTWVFRESSQLPINGPPRLFGDGDRLFVLQDGQELIRLDPGTGAKLWARLLGTEDLSERPDAFTFGTDRVFVACGGDLIAARLTDGVPVWKQPLNGPSHGWVVALTDRSVVAFPSAARMDRHEGATFPLVLHRRADGELIQRLQFPTSPADLAVRFSPHGVTVATSTGVWGLGDRPAMDATRPGR